ncbi:response regulator [Stygiobacter electus]|uniref:Response regulator n=1 Tax=Stygiobacter electus TaxID=3032292 RepID=A0AAE3NVH7_9BACT|nr:response regulator [Stygiobacter electus]MDF1610821.1 response regulator [Stygiobacter electus]
MSERIKILFVDDEKYILDGLKRMLAFQRTKWDMFFVTNGNDAIEIALNNKIDVIITDMRMPIMNGAELLDNFHKNFPHTIRIILSGYSDYELILKTVKTSHQFLAKPINSDELITVIDNCLKSRELINSNELIDIINGIENLPSLPNIYFELEEELNNEEISLLKIENIIKKDISLTAKILQLSNSSYFATAVKTTDIKTALNILGINVVKSLIIYLNLSSYLTKEKINEKYLEEIWSHSLKTSEIAKTIVKEIDISKFVAQEIYATTLLHDIGKIILLKHKKYQQIIKEMNRLPNHTEEIELLNFSHANVGAYLLQLWNLPAMVVEAISSHHEMQFFNEKSLSSLLYYANKIANNDFTDLDSNFNNQKLFEKFKQNFQKSNGDLC